MKKIYTIVTALLIGASAQAQSVIDFESFTLSGPETFDNGSAGGGDFVVDAFTFSNYYDPGGWWNGFAISNTTDITTPGFMNQYSAITGSGHDGSDNYAVHYSPGGIQGVGPAQAIDSFKITNTTYAALSMKLGDSYAKKFGSPNNAAGDPDGTNGADYFRVWMICKNFTETMVDSIEFYLADFRFVDSTMDYILYDWKNVDVSGLGFDVNRIDFRFESSDMSFGYINTPTYFALDDMSVRNEVGVDELDQLAVRCYPNPVQNVLNVNGGTGSLDVRDVQGNVLLAQEHELSSTLDFSNLPHGVYFVRLTNESGQFVQKVIK